MQSERENARYRFMWSWCVSLGPSCVVLEWGRCTRARRLVGWMGVPFIVCYSRCAVSISNTHLYSCGIRLVYSRLPKNCI